MKLGAVFQHEQPRGHRSAGDLSQRGGEAHTLEDYLPTLQTYDPKTLDSQAVRQLVAAYQAQIDWLLGLSPEEEAAAAGIAPPEEKKERRARRTTRRSSTSRWRRGGRKH